VGRWPASFDAVSRFAFLHMFPEPRHRCVLRKMLRAATSRVLITTTEHAGVSEVMVPKEIVGRAADGTLSPPLHTAAVAGACRGVPAGGVARAVVAND
jgi:hypothetical protein